MSYTFRPLSRRTTAVLTAAALVAGSLGVTFAARAAAAAPAPPTNLTLTPSDVSTDGMVELSWNAPKSGEVAYYQIFRTNSADDLALTPATFLKRTEDDATFAEDEILTEGIFFYAVVAVDPDGRATRPSNWVPVTVDLDDDGVIEPDETAPPAPTDLLLGGEYTSVREVTLAWSQPETPDLWRFLVYRSVDEGPAEMVGYVDGSALEFTETLADDGLYAYTVVAQDLAGNLSEASDAAAIHVDTVAPVVAITQPADLGEYPQDGVLRIRATVEEAGAGYEADSVEYFLDDQLLTGGVIDLEALEPGVHQLEMWVADRAGNLGSDSVHFTVLEAAAEPGAPDLAGLPRYQNSRTVELSWKAPALDGLARYLVYRAAGDGDEAVIARLDPGARSLADSLPADGIYTYRVEARYESGESFSSRTVATTVDTIAPVIQIDEPESGAVYGAETRRVYVDVTALDRLSGVADSDIAYFLDGVEMDGDVIDLTLLADGGHTFKVVATDRAGNQATASVRFEVQAGRGDEDDEDEWDDDNDWDDDRECPNKHLRFVLKQYRPEIHHGHYNALWAFTKNGNLKAFRDHVTKFRGKFLSEMAADALLEALGDDMGKHGIKWTKWDKDDDDDDDWREPVVNGKNGNKGKDKDKVKDTDKDGGWGKDWNKGWNKGNGKKNK